jgi:hypothetical protein
MQCIVLKTCTITDLNRGISFLTNVYITEKSQITWITYQRICNNLFNNHNSAINTHHVHNMLYKQNKRSPRLRYILRFMWWLELMISIQFAETYWVVVPQLVALHTMAWKQVNCWLVLNMWHASTHRAALWMNVFVSGENKILQENIMSNS